MKRRYAFYRNQRKNGTFFYEAENIEDFMFNKDTIRHGLNGIVSLLNGQYALSTKVLEKIGEVELSIEVPNCSASMPIYIFDGKLEERFPFDGESLILSIDPMLYYNGKLKENLYRVNIFDPLIHYFKENDTQLICLKNFVSHNMKGKENKDRFLLKTLFPRYNP